jgi:hypothetical protein
VESCALSFEEFKLSVVPAFRGVFRDVDPFGTPFQDAAPERAILYPVGYLPDEEQLSAIAASASAIGDSGFYAAGTEHEFIWRELLEDPTELDEPPHMPTEFLALGPQLARQAWAALNRTSSRPVYDDDPAWWIAVDDLGSGWPSIYSGGARETALISRSGQWGLLTSHQSHAVVGGTLQFVETLLTRFPSAAGMAERGADGEWREPEAALPAAQVLVFLREVRHWQEPMTWLPAHLAHIYGEDRAQVLLRAAGFIE